MIKVLIVDDDVSTAKMVGLMLQQEGLETFVVNSGREGIEAVHQLNPDVIILDLMMPGIDGWQVCRTIRTFSQVPILIFSSVIDSERVSRALAEGANDYLVKPVPSGVMVSRLKKLANNFKPST